jgi:hypothetical protein
MLVELDDTMRLNIVQQLFNDMFPFLKIEFFEQEILDLLDYDKTGFAFPNLLYKFTFNYSNIIAIFNSLINFRVFFFSSAVS